MPKKTSPINDLAPLAEAQREVIRLTKDIVIAEHQRHSAEVIATLAQNLKVTEEQVRKEWNGR